MKLIDKISVIISKVCSLLIIFYSFLLFPYMKYYCNVNFYASNIIAGVLLCIIIFSFGMFSLLKTNSPDNRYNPFTINKNWKNKMEKSMMEDPGKFFTLDEKTKEKVRIDKINKIINDV